MSSTPSPLSDPAYHFLLNHRASDHAPFQLSFGLVLATLKRLGADPAILKNMDWDVSADLEVEQSNVETSRRAEVLYRLVSLVAMSAR